MPWPVVRRLSSVVRCPSSVVRPALAFHIFDISSRIVSRIELKLGGRYCGYMEIQN